MNWIIAFHIIFVITWFSGLFYLPRLFVYHAMCEDKNGTERFKIMERKLYYGIMWPSAVLATFFGLWLIAYHPTYYLQQTWLLIKLLLVLLLWIFHFSCGRYYKIFKADKNHHSHVFYRWFNELPTVLLIVIVILAIVRPGT